MKDTGSSLAGLAALLQVDEAELISAALLSQTGEKDYAKAIAFVTEQQADNAVKEFAFEVPGEPSAAKRARRRNPKDGSKFMFDPDEDVKLTLGALIAREVKLTYPEFVPLQGEAQVDLAIYKAPPKGWPAYKVLLGELGFITPTGKPDCDNYAKLIVDSVRTVLFLDDAQITYLGTFKYYSARPRTVLRVSGRQFRMVK